MSDNDRHLASWHERCEKTNATKTVRCRPNEQALTRCRNSSSLRQDKDAHLMWCAEELADPKFMPEGWAVRATEQSPLRDMRKKKRKRAPRTLPISSSPKRRNFIFLASKILSPHPFVTLPPNSPPPSLGKVQPRVEVKHDSAASTRSRSILTSHMPPTSPKTFPSAFRRQPSRASTKTHTGFQRPKLQAHVLPEPSRGVHAVGAPGDGVLQGDGVHASRG